VSPKLSRLLLIGAVAAGFGVLPMHGALADSGVDVYNPPVGFANGAASGNCQGDRSTYPTTRTTIGATVRWYVKEGTHNVTPAEDVPGGQKWGPGPSGELTPSSDPYPVKFDKPGLYYYFSGTGGEGSDKHGVLSGMCGVINVEDPNATTTTTAPPAPPTTTPDTQPPTTTPTNPPSGPAPTVTTTPPTSPGTHAPTTAPPAPTTTTAKADKKQPKDSSTTTATTAPPAINLPPEAIIPDISGTGAATQNGVVQPSSTPQGDAVALIKHKHSDNAKKMLVLTGLGIGALGIGTAGYKWAHRSSKYFPA
jgi:hypothetical protein